MSVEIKAREAIFFSSVSVVSENLLYSPDTQQMSPHLSLKATVPPAHILHVLFNTTHISFEGLSSKFMHKGERFKIHGFH